VNPRIVPFAPVHGTAAVEIIRNVFVEYGMTFDLDGFDADLLDVPASYLAPGGTFAVLLDDERVIGTVAALPHDHVECEIKRLYLLPAARGQGHGRRLLEHVLGWARDAGHRRAIAWSDVRLARAHVLYSRLGFARIGERECEDIDRSREYGFALDLAAGR
jgi:GNAT superfamily N-acetyltransferase